MAYFPVLSVVILGRSRDLLSRRDITGQVMPAAMQGAYDLHFRVAVFFEPEKTVGVAPMQCIDLVPADHPLREQVNDFIGLICRSLDDEEPPCRREGRLLTVSAKHKRIVRAVENLEPVLEDVDAVRTFERADDALGLLLGEFIAQQNLRCAAGN